ncbi:MAG: hypothetical protein NC340_05060 [Ruminococcus flavefaciens]|nr:hypothetical protein [Ruminococcus flavefaciens]MCM1228965.1 hypothetical protein [Ruminococcus flavefaciens]
MSDKKDTELEKTEKTLNRVLIAIIVVILLLFGAYKLFFDLDITYHIFGKNRKAEMEETFGITVTDDIKLERYNEFGWLSFTYTLDISNIADCDKFMQDNVKGKLARKIENGIIYNYEDNTREFSDYYEQYHKDEIEYIYIWGNSEIYADFYDHNNDGYYSATLYKCE